MMVPMIEAVLCTNPTDEHQYLLRSSCHPGRGEGGGGEIWLLELIFVGYVPLASQYPYPIIVYSVAKHRPHVSHFWEM